MRRRQRRLRLWRGPGSGNEQYYTAKFRNIPPPRRLVPSTLRWMPGRTWVRHQPPGGQHRCLRCCRRTGFSGAPWSRSSTQYRLDMLSPLDFRVAEQVIGVPKIVCPLRAARTVLRAPQLAEQLVEVPTPVPYSSLLQRIMEQNVDIPVPPGRGGRKVFSQNRVQQQRFLLQNAFLSGLSSRTSTCLLLVEAFTIFAQARVHPQLHALQLIGSILRMRCFNGFFALFPKTKKVRHNLRTRGRNCLRTRAHGRRLPLTSLKRSRRRRRSPRTSLTLTSSTWSLMGAGGGASGSRLASSVAGGWLRQTGHRLAIQCGGPRGSSAEGQGDWGLVRQWIHGCVSSWVFVPCCTSFLREGELGS